MLAADPVLLVGKRNEKNQCLECLSIEKAYMFMIIN